MAVIGGVVSASIRAIWEAGDWRWPRNQEMDCVPVSVAPPPAVSTARSSSTLGDRGRVGGSAIGSGLVLADYKHCD